MTIKLLIEGWKNYVHSYSIVNIYQMISLSKDSEITLYFKEVPGYRENWPRKEIQNFILDETEQQILDNVLDYSEDIDYDFIYRISYPFDLSSSKINLKTMKSIPIFLFYTSEFKTLKDSDFIYGDVKSFVSGCFSGKFIPITPSNWSAEALIKQKFKPIVIPHGVDTNKFYVQPRDLTSNLKETLDIPENAFIFLNVSAMTGNKNIKGILKAFYNLRILMPDAYLILKGLEGLYSCQNKITGYIKELQKEDNMSFKEISKRVIYIPSTYDYKDMNNLYNLCDCYISPYLAEGFNIPVLDALACGKPVIVPKGGPTDDFTTAELAIYPVTVNMTINETDSILVTDNFSLQNSMYDIYSNKELRDSVKILGPQFVEKFSWSNAASKISSLCNYFS